MTHPPGSCAEAAFKKSHRRHGASLRTGSNTARWFLGESTMARLPKGRAGDRAASAPHGTRLAQAPDPAARHARYGLNENPTSSFRMANSPPGGVRISGHDSEVSFPSLSRVTNRA